MTDSFLYDVFLSYSSKDKAVVRDIAGRLKADGLRVWFDEWELKPGDSIPAKIKEGLENSRVLVLCISEHAFGSDWAQLESGTFRFRDPLNKERRFIPLRLDNTPVKGSLAQFLCINWFPGVREQEYPKLLEACRPVVRGDRLSERQGEFLAVVHLLGHSGGVNSVVFSPNGKYALSGSEDKAMRLWEFKSGLCLCIMEGHSARVWSVALSPDGKQALSGSSDNTVRLWDVKSGQCLRVMEGHSASILSVAFCPDGKHVLSGSSDTTIRLWDAKSCWCLRVLKGHFAKVWSVLFRPDGKQALSGSSDNTIRLWDVESGRCLRVMKVHSDKVWSVALSSNGEQALSGSSDNKIRLWDVESGRCIRVMEGHSASVLSVAFSPTGEQALSGSSDNMVLLWDVKRGQCLGTFEGHSAKVLSVAFSPDGKQALSGSEDKTVRLWEVNSGRCSNVMEGHSSRILSMAFSPDGKQALSGSGDNTIRLWDIKNRRCVRVMERHAAKILSVAFSPDGKQILSGSEDKTIQLGAINYSWYRVLEGHTASVLSVSFSPDGKYALSGSADKTVRLPGIPDAKDLEQEIWIWDFGGQADQRLVHQLYMDHAALILLLFDSNKEDVLPGLREWQTALRRCVDPWTLHFLVAGRIDTGFKASRSKLKRFARENDFYYFETSSKEGTGCDELSKEIKSRIPWDHLEKRTSPRVFKHIKDQILKLRDEGQILYTFKELREVLQHRLSEESHFSNEILQTVIGLLVGPCVVKELEYGTYILLQPEWINTYAQAVLHTLRQDPAELGCLPLRSIEEGKLLFHTEGDNGNIVYIKRLPEDKERVVLREMERQLEERGLCLRQGNKLVFPSHCGRDRSSVAEHPTVFTSYTVKGYLDDIYATLVVRLADSESFSLKDLWRNAADFVTLAGNHHMGIKLTRNAVDSWDISIYFGLGVTMQEQVIFSNYIHAHLQDRCEEVQRLRYYVCPYCHTPKGNPKELMKKLMAKKKDAVVYCDICEKRFSLWDDLEKLFASDDIRRQVEGLQTVDAVRLDSRRKGKLLVLEVASRITSADQKCFEIPATEDEGIDMELEFTDDDGKGTGKRLYLQLKSGNSHLEKRKDGTEIFRIKKQRWVDYWLKQPCPVMLVIGTFAQEDDLLGGKEKLEFAEVRWMEISSYLKQASQDGTKPVNLIEFKDERLDMTSIHKWRAKMLKEGGD